MNVLKKTFKKYGDNFTQIEQKGDWYIYSRTSYKWDRLPGEKVDKNVFTHTRTHYELVKPKSVNMLSPGDTIYTARQPQNWVYPNPADWGSRGFTFMTLKKANAKLKQLIKK